MTVELLTYNLFLRSPVMLFHDHQRARVRALPSALPVCDIIVFQEVFDAGLRRRLLAALAVRYPHHTRTQGGVVLISQWPIEHEARLSFGRACAGSDCLARKGVVYARVRMPQGLIHVFGVHCQNGAAHRAVRSRQLLALRGFMNAMQVPVAEPVFIAGDFNIDVLSDDRDGEYSSAIQMLDAAAPPDLRGLEREPTYDARANPLTRERLTACVDHVLYSTVHRIPVRSAVEVRRLRTGGQDLSDHYAVYARAVFTAPPS